MSPSYVVCPVCLWNRPISSSSSPGFDLPWGEYEGDPADVPVIQLREVRAGPGRGHKVKGVGAFPVVGTLSMSEALQDSAHSDVAEDLRVRLIDLVRDYVATGIIDIAELTE